MGAAAEARNHRQALNQSPPAPRPTPRPNGICSSLPQVKPSDLFGEWDKPFQPDPKWIPLQLSSPRTNLRQTDLPTQLPRHQDRPPFATRSTSESVSFAAQGKASDRQPEYITSSNVGPASHEPHHVSRFLATTYPKMIQGQINPGGRPINHPIVTNWGPKLLRCIRSCIEAHCKAFKPNQLASIDLRFILSSNGDLADPAAPTETPVIISVGVKPLSLGAEDVEAEQKATYLATKLWHNFRDHCKRNDLDIGLPQFYVEVLEVENGLFSWPQSKVAEALWPHSPELDDYPELIEAIQPFSPCLPLQIESRSTDPVTNLTRSSTGTVGLVFEVPESGHSPGMILGLTARHVVCGTDDRGVYRSMELDSQQAENPTRYGIYLRHTADHIRKLKQGIAYIEHGPMAQAKYAVETSPQWQTTVDRMKRQLRVVENLVDGQIGELLYAAPRCPLQNQLSPGTYGAYCDLAVFKFHESLHELLRAHGGFLDTRQVSTSAKWSLFRQHELFNFRDADLIDRSLSTLGGLHHINAFEDLGSKPPFLVFMHGASSGLQLGAIEKFCVKDVDLEGVYGYVSKVGLVNCPHRGSGTLFGQWRQYDNPDKFRFFAKEGDSGASVISTDHKYLGIIVGGTPGGSDPAWLMDRHAISEVLASEPRFKDASLIHCPFGTGIGGQTTEQQDTDMPSSPGRMVIDTVFSQTTSRQGKPSKVPSLSKQLSGLFKNSRNRSQS